MGLSDRTVKKLMVETEETGGKIYEEDDDLPEEEITHFEEDSDPQSLAGDPVDEDSPVGEVPEGGKA
jgi:hypothetical protein